MLTPLRGRGALHLDEYGCSRQKPMSNRVGVFSPQNYSDITRERQVMKRTDLATLFADARAGIAVILLD